MLNNFTKCPICQGKLTFLKGVTQGLFKLKVCGQKQPCHFRNKVGRYEDLIYPQYEITFYYNSVSIYLNSERKTYTIKSNFRFEDLGSYERCLEVVRNYEILS